MQLMGVSVARVGNADRSDILEEIAVTFQEGKKAAEASITTEGTRRISLKEEVFEDRRKASSLSRAGTVASSVTSGSTVAKGRTENPRSRIWQMPTWKEKWL